MAIDWSAFGDMTAIAEEVANISSGDFEKKDVPFGDYEVRVTKLEVEECPFDGDYKGLPQLAAWFRIINNDEYAGQTLFVTKRLLSAKGASATAFMVRQAIDFINSLEPSIEVTFDDHFEDTVKAVFDEVGNGKAEYQLSYHEEAAKNGKMYKQYAIVQKFK